MADSEALSLLENQKRPNRRSDKTYGKKKGLKAPSRAMHFDLFGGDDENNITEKMSQLTVENDRDKTVQPVQQSPAPIEKPSAHHNPRLRGRRKPTSRRMAALGQDKLEALTPLLSLTQREVRDFQEFGRGLGKKYVCTKLGEGSFADVFELRPKESEEAIKLEERGGLVIKVIAFDVEKSDETDDIADMESVIREVRVLLALDQMHGFARCRGVHVVSGKYPDVLLEAFENFKDTNAIDAQNLSPTNLSEHQTYVIIEMDHAGSPLSKFGSLSAFQAYDIFWKTAIILSGAEGEFEFEHRDLHNGNLCFRPRSTNGVMDVTDEIVQNMTEEPLANLGLSNLQVTIIDYTLSRAKISSESEGELIIFDAIKFWEDNDDTGEHASDQRQFDTYRKVRDWAKAVEAKVEAMAEIEEDYDLEVVDKYARFLPKSNVMWLSYVAREFLWRRADGRGAIVAGSSKVARRLQLLLWRKLEAVAAYLVGSPMLIPESAADLLETAVQLEWLSWEDVAAFRAELEV
ncbi:hypothetical protein LTR46_001561 [Exophiala xenobiotica]|nr:hypothetical protein LTR46_001561 [Exophiala xenobiotica]